MLDAHPPGKAGVTADMLRGQLLLATGQPHSAVEALRRCVFLAPGNVLARYWYAQALRAAGRSAAAAAQMQEVRRRADAYSDRYVLEDGETLGTELRLAL